MQRTVQRGTTAANNSESEPGSHFEAHVLFGQPNAVQAIAHDGGPASPAAKQRFEHGIG
jgi:hypothetical protein